MLLYLSPSMASYPLERHSFLFSFTLRSELLTIQDAPYCTPWSCHRIKLLKKCWTRQSSVVERQFHNCSAWTLRIFCCRMHFFLLECSLLSSFPFFFVQRELSSASKSNHKKGSLNSTITHSWRDTSLWLPFCNHLHTFEGQWKLSVILLNVYLLLKMVRVYVYVYHYQSSLFRTLNSLFFFYMF